MVLMALFTTFITTPIVTSIYKQARKSDAKYKHRTIEREDSTTQLRIMACFHSSWNIPSLINLIEASRGTNRQEGLCVYAMHLMEMSERPSTILMVQKARKNGLPFWNKTLQSGSDQVVVAFQAFERLSRVSVRLMTAISDLSDIHEDICTSAERKQAAILILPFHKRQRFDGVLETARPEFRNVNRKVLENAPCSVGLFVDRGLGGSSHVSASDLSSSITVLFFGGRNDREALAYGTRMAEHPGIRLTVLRFCASEPGSVREITAIDMEADTLSERRSSDDRFIDVFRERSKNDEAIQYEETVVSNRQEIVSAIQAYSCCNLFLVGRNPEGPASVALMSERAECPELGPVGSLLQSPSLSFPVSASVLVVQQYSGTSSTTATATTTIPSSSEESSD